MVDSPFHWDTILCTYARNVHFAKAGAVKFGDLGVEISAWCFCSYQMQRFAEGTVLSRVRLLFLLSHRA
jgi:hypothetical protein